MLHLAREAQGCGIAADPQPPGIPVEPGINREFFWSHRQSAADFKWLGEIITKITGNFLRLTGNCFRITGKIREITKRHIKMPRAAEVPSAARYDDGFMAKSGSVTIMALAADAKRPATA
jgi:hypothetical protein